MTCYRITYRDSQHKEHTLPVIQDSAFKAVEDLQRLGYDIQKVTCSFPSV